MGPVLAYEPPERVVFSWDISPQWQLETDESNASEVEVLFVAETPDAPASSSSTATRSPRTRLGIVRGAIDSDGGWPLYWAATRILSPGSPSSRRSRPNRGRAPPRCRGDVPVRWPQSRLPDGCDGGLERGVEAVTVERLEETVATNQVLEPGAHLRERHVDARGVELAVELLEHPAADTSTSVIASHWTTIHDGWRFGDDVADLGPEGWQLAKNSGASQR